MANNSNGAFVIMQTPAGVGIFMAALNIFLSIFATLGNAVILVALQKVSAIHPPTKLLFRCLAVTDLCVGLISQPLYVYYILTSYLDIGNPIVEILDADVFFYYVLLAVSPLTSAAISVDRLLALLLGLRYRHVVTLCRVRVVIACFWLIAVSNSSLLWVYLILFSDKVSLAMSWTFLVLTLISIIISTFSYTKIFFTLRHRQAQVQNNVQPEQSSRMRSVLTIARYKTTVYSAAWIQFAMLACYGPYIILTILYYSGKKSYITTEIEIALEFSYCLCFFNSSLNPVLYCWRIKDVRRQVKNTIRKCLCC